MPFLIPLQLQIQSPISTFYFHFKTELKATSGRVFHKQKHKNHFVLHNNKLFIMKGSGMHTCHLFQKGYLFVNTVLTYTLKAHAW